MKKSVKKWLNLLLAGALAASVLAGCGGSGSGTPAKEESAQPAAENTAGAETQTGDLLAKIQNTERRQDRDRHGRQLGSVDL